MIRRFVPLALVPALLGGCFQLGNLPPDHRRGIVLSLDAGGQEVMDHFVADGMMPNLAKLRADGATAEFSRTNYPSKTAAGHAALWTGTFGDFNGITSNRVFQLPLADHSILDVADGFDSGELLAEPLWVTAARAGRRSVVLQATHVAPLSTYAPGGRYGGPFPGTMTLMDGYGGVLAQEAVFADKGAWKPATGWDKLPMTNKPCREARIEVGDYSWFALEFDSPSDPKDGYDTLAIFQSKVGLPVATLRPGNDPLTWSHAVQVPFAKGTGQAFFKLFSLAPEGDDWLLYMTPPSAAVGNKPEALAAYYGANPFIAQGAVQMWSSGQFGKTMYQGGDGTAEARYLDTVDFFIDRAIDRVGVLRGRKDWDLAVTYLPFPDEALHAWFGTVDERSPSYDAALAPRVWKLLDRVGAACDRYVGALRGDPDTVVCVTSDHGMAGLKWKFFPNVVLRQAGLLALTPDGKVDLAHTQAYYPATDGAFLVINKRGRKGGIVPPAEVPEVLKRTEDALRSVRAADGTPLVNSFVYPHGNDRLEPVKLPDGRLLYDDLDVGGIRGGDLYLDLHRGYYFSPDASPAAATSAYGPGQGGHVFDPRRPEMHAAMAFAGPGVRAGVKLGPVRNIDMAPTLMHLLGMPKPARATGRVLEEALAK
ncbi:MAG: Type phosphodiesterase / nucleotide pyrophosphatase [Cyanobacteria bacterium RYN_339]|nr:Type phosphodiesterase / nucleotide pyrophosphatase [Cyanobacteria bacterium RYN_339]